jgi:hypothetical protein
MKETFTGAQVIDTVKEALELSEAQLRRAFNITYSQFTVLKQAENIYHSTRHGRRLLAARTLIQEGRASGATLVELKATIMAALNKYVQMEDELVIFG